MSGEVDFQELTLPLTAYAILDGAAFNARSYTRTALFLVGAAALLLFFIGIHNAWDTLMQPSSLPGNRDIRRLRGSAVSGLV
jgi:hypothetical protein